ncbi:MAG: histidinol-phosphate transaminase [bacterium]|nr:histidinol-phosphate transaminase [bacterium]
MSIEALVRSCIIDLEPYEPGKPVEEVERELGITGVIKMASNENPLGPSPLAVEAVRRAAARMEIYPDGNAYYLKRELASLLGVGEDQLFIGNGSDEIIHFLGITYLHPGDEVIVADPSFSRYDSVATLMNATLIKVPLKDFRHDLEAMAAQFSPRTKLVFVCNPNNPTGTIVGRDEVERFLEKLPADAIVVFDEAYCEYVEADDYPDSLRYIGEGRHVVTLRTFSKIYGLAGLRVGYAVSSPEITAHLNRVKEPFNVNSLALTAALASLRDPDQVERSRRLVLEGKRFLQQSFVAMGLTCIPTEANFIMVRVGLDSRDVFKALMARGIIVRTGDIFGLQDYIRVTIGTAKQNERFVTALADVLGKE